MTLSTNSSCAGPGDLTNTRPGGATLRPLVPAPPTQDAPGIVRPTPDADDRAPAAMHTLLVSPRPAPTRHDAAAMTYLNAAASLIDASLAAHSERRSPRLSSLHYPAALDWIRIEDILRLARDSGESVSKRALINRWPAKEDFIRDAVIHAMLYRDDVTGDPVNQVPTLQTILNAQSFSVGVSAVADNLLDVLISHPRSFLLAHIAPLLPRHPALADDIRVGGEESLRLWSNNYRELLLALDLNLRPDWPIERLALAIQLVLDGVVMRSRIQPDSVIPSRWATASLYSDTVLAIVSGALDPEQDGMTMRDWLDSRIQWHIGQADNARG